MGENERLPFLTPKDMNDLENLGVTLPRITYISETPQDESDAKYLTPPSWNFISEGAAEEFNRIVNEYCRTCEECLPMKRKARKHYKPKFTL